MDTNTPGMNAQGRTVLVWDLYTRLFHWLIVALVPAAYATWRLNWMDWHVLIGNALLTLLLFRLIWGFVGSETARFARLLASPRCAARHLARLFHREPDEQIGHNPAGGWMVLVLLALLFGETLTGIVVNNDVADEGPLTGIMPAKLANLLTDLHAVLWEALLAAMALHVTAIVIYAVAKGHNLLHPMLTGRKWLPDRSAPPRLASFALALLVLACSATAAALLANFL
jgi:cytochrome b